MRCLVGISVTCYKKARDRPRTVNGSVVGMDLLMCTIALNRKYLITKNLHNMFYSNQFLLKVVFTFYVNIFLNFLLYSRKVRGRKDTLCGVSWWWWGSLRMEAAQDRLSSHSMGRSISSSGLLKTDDDDAKHFWCQ